VILQKKKKRLVEMKKVAMNLAAALSVATLATAVHAATPLELYQQITDPQQRLYFRTQIAKPDGSDMVYFWEGDIFISIPGNVYAPGYKHGGGNSGTPIMGMVGYNIRNVVPAYNADGTMHATDFWMATREVVFYTNPNNHAVRLDSFYNPITLKTTPVMPVLNEYLFTRYRVESGVLKYVMTINYGTPPYCGSFPASGSVGTPWVVGGLGTVASDIYPSYKLNACGRYGINDDMNLTGGNYASEEHFHFYYEQGAINKILDEAVHGVDSSWTPEVALTWIRQGPYLPWMCAHEQDYVGTLSYAAQSELLGSWDDIPQYVKDMMATYQYPAGGLTYEGWQEAPTAYIPGYVNDTSWSVFYKYVLQPSGQGDWDNWCASVGAPRPL
jgi:hypothetical protein